METRCICKIRSVYRQIMKFETDLEKEYGLNINEAMLLCLLTEKESLLAGDIADELDVEGHREYGKEEIYPPPYV